VIAVSAARSWDRSVGLHLGPSSRVISAIDQWFAGPVASLAGPASGGDVVDAAGRAAVGDLKTHRKNATSKSTR
jgi:hypothetical protein